MNAVEQHFSPKQLADLWGFSPDFIRDTFRKEPGVLAINRPEKLHKKGYLTLRIPASVAARVHSRLEISR